MKVTMPEPIGWITRESIDRLDLGGNDSKGTVPIHKSRSYVAKTPVLLATQAEAYANERILAVLREVAEIADDNNDFKTFDAVLDMIDELRGKQ